jgi:hypothetical protein
MNGLFTTVARSQGDILCSYTGDLLSEEEFRERYPDTSVAHYCLALSVPDRPRSTVTIDARSTQSCVARYINDGTPSRISNNCTFKLVHTEEGGRIVHVRAMRDLAAGTELFLAYGEAYWKQRGSIQAVSAEASSSSLPHPPLSA